MTCVTVYRDSTLPDRSDRAPSRDSGKKHKCLTVSEFSEKNAQLISLD